MTSYTNTRPRRATPPAHPVIREQLSLLDYVPTPEEMAPAIDPDEFQPAPTPTPAQPIASPFKLGDRVRCPKGEGRVYHIHPNSVWVSIGNVAEGWDLDEVEAIELAAPTFHKIAFLESQAALYLRLIQRFMAGRKCSQAVRFSEIERLTAMREQVLEQIKTLELAK